MWPWIWTALAVGGLVAFVLFVWWLWRRLRALWVQVGDSGQQLAVVAESVADKVEERMASLPDLGSGVGQDPVELLMRVEDLRTRRLARRDHRLRPRPQVYRLWTSIYR